MKGFIGLIVLLVLGMIVAPDATQAILVAIGDAATQSWPHVLTLLQELAAACGRFLAGLVSLAQNGTVP